MKFIKFDTLYPVTFFEELIQSNFDSIQRMDTDQFTQWTINKRITFSDYYSYNLSTQGWIALEIFLDNKTFRKKYEHKYLGYSALLLKIFNRIRNLIYSDNKDFKEILLKRIIKTEKPDVIFVRENSNFQSSFWKQFKSSLVVARLDCAMPLNWSPYDFDLVYTNIPAFTSFFKSNNIKTSSNPNGFDNRILSEITFTNKKHDVVYIGGLGSEIFKERTNFFEDLLRKTNNKFHFSWWGYKTGDFDKDYPLLASAYCGKTGGIDMFSHLASAKICINDFDSNLSTLAVNMRIYEVLGVGSFLLTRYNDRFKDWQSFLDTYENTDDCLQKIIYYLNNDSLREGMAIKGQEFVLKNYNYSELMKDLGNELKQHYLKKFNHLPE